MPPEPLVMYLRKGVRDDKRFIVQYCELVCYVVLTRIEVKNICKSHYLFLTLHSQFLQRISNNKLDTYGYY